MPDSAMESDVMSQVIFATVENGLLKPDRKISLSSGTKVRMTVEVCDDASVPAGAACDALDELCHELPIDLREDRLTRDQLLHDRR